MHTKVATIHHESRKKQAPPTHTHRHTHKHTHTHALVIFLYFPLFCSFYGTNETRHRANLGQLNNDELKIT